MTPLALRVQARKQHKGFEKLLALGGLWEIVKGKGKAITPAPFWVWEGLATHTPAAAELAAQAADVASAARYFEVSLQALAPHRHYVHGLTTCYYTDWHNWNFNKDLLRAVCT